MPKYMRYSWGKQKKLTYHRLKFATIPTPKAVRARNFGHNKRG